ncbi:MAG: chain length determinant protein (polysaccharide antigen chain regulator) [Oleiphilaceae bacterium]|jgi:chain length determinant protein (polysaccharide antigen chain regulator)
MMTNPSQQQTAYQNNDQIDLFEFLSMLWQEKFKIISATFVFMLLSVVYAFNVTETWSVSSTVDTPTSQQVKQYNLNRVFVNEGIRMLNKNAGLDTTLATTEQVINITTNNSNSNSKELPDINELHELFVSEARMTTNQVKFFKTQQLFKAVVAEQQLDQIEQNNYAYEWVNGNISFTAENQNKVNFNDKIGTNLSISAVKPEDALALNQAYLSYMNEIMMDRTRDLMTSELALAIQQIVNYEASYVNNERVILEKKIYAIEQNIKVAKQANIKNFVTQNISLQSAPEYTKGYEILAAEKFVLIQQRENYDSHAAAMSSNALLIKKWRNFNDKMQLDDFNFYRFTDEPKLPKTRDKPKRALILIFGTLVGLMLSISYVLVTLAVSKHKKTKEA